MKFSSTEVLGAIALASVLALSVATVAAPALDDPTVGTLELVTPSAAAQQSLNVIDGLAFDNYGNLFGVREVSGSSGGVVYIDKATGSVTTLVTGISRADQIALHPDGKFYVTSELSSPSTTNRLWRISVTYDAQHRPVSATKSSLTTSLTIDDPEGLVVLPISTAYGNAGDLYAAEDASPGRIIHTTTGGAASSLASSLQRPEGLAFGDFAGAASPALYAAETSTHRVIRIGSDGTVATLGTPANVSLTYPDNVEFGPDGYLYISEDRPGPSSRLVRVSADGTHSVFATGFSQAQGLVFDPTNGDLFIAEQNLDRVWRVAFANAIYGDYNHDGTVDAADYTVWCDNVGQLGAGLMADGNRDYQVDSNDLLIWNATFGHSHAAGAGDHNLDSASVPEPASLLLVAIVALSTLLVSAAKIA